jgi:hypothetical protein
LDHGARATGDSMLRKEECCYEVSKLLVHDPEGGREGGRTDEEEPYSMIR